MMTTMQYQSSSLNDSVEKGLNNDGRLSLHVNCEAEKAIQAIALAKKQLAETNEKLRRYSNRSHHERKKKRAERHKIETEKRKKKDIEKKKEHDLKVERLQQRMSRLRQKKQQQGEQQEQKPQEEDSTWSESTNSSSSDSESDSEGDSDSDSERSFASSSSSSSCDSDSSSSSSSGASLSSASSRSRHSKRRYGGKKSKGASPKPHKNSFTTASKNMNTTVNETATKATGKPDSPTNHKSKVTTTKITTPRQPKPLPSQVFIKDTLEQQQQKKEVKEDVLNLLPEAPIDNNDDDNSVRSHSTQSTVSSEEDGYQEDDEEDEFQDDDDYALFLSDSSYESEICESDFEFDCPPLRRSSGRKSCGSSDESSASSCRRIVRRPPTFNFDFSDTEISSSGEEIRVPRRSILKRHHTY